MKKTGRFRQRDESEIDWQQVYRLAAIYCTMEEISYALNIDRSVLTGMTKFHEVYNRGLARARRSLRRLQWQAAKSGERGMLIWLGKQLLGQREAVAHEVVGPGGGPVEVTDPRRPDLSRLPVEDLAVLRAIMLKAKGQAKGQSNDTES